jgi:hypothetical protein
VSLPAKDPGARRRYNQPARGEWTDLVPLSEPVLPAYPIDWYRRDQQPFVVPKFMWDAWRSDPVTSQWSSSDAAQALELGQRFYRYKDSERLRVMTYLGLNARGRRDLRWREPQEQEAVKTTERAEVRRLRIVAPEEPGEGT